MFSTEISFYYNLKAPPTTITLQEWIRLNTTYNQFTEKVINYRDSKDAQLKRSLPLVTVGGVFKSGRKGSDLITKTGWLSIDIDHKDNTHLPSADIIRDQVANISYVAFSCLSVSGRGVWALLKVQDSNRQEEHFKQIKADFAYLNIFLDPTKGKNPNDARFLSFDPQAKLNPEFAVYDRVPVKKAFKSKPYLRYKISSTLDFNHILSQISKNTIDIAPDYESYRNIGFAIADEFGEAGRQLFHDLICYSPKYNLRDADLQYSNCLKSKGSGITLGTLTHYLKQNNIEIRR